MFNKIDNYHFIEQESDNPTPLTQANLSLEDLEKSWMAKIKSPCIFISATKKINVEKFRNLIYNKVKEIHVTRYPYDNLMY